MQVVGLPSSGRAGSAYSPSHQRPSFRCRGRLPVGFGYQTNLRGIIDAPSTSSTTRLQGLGGGGDNRENARSRSESSVQAAAADQPVDPSVGLQPSEPKNFSKVVNRAAFGLLLGIFGAFVIVSGGVLFASAIGMSAYQAAREFNNLVVSMGSKQRTFAPPGEIFEVLIVFCILLPLMTYFFPTGGKPALMLSLAAFILLCMEVLTVEKPKFSQLTAAVFGLFYCGFLPSFWVKLRMLAIPALKTPFASSWPLLMGGLTHWTVGLVATLTATICIIAADTGAYIVGKNFGRTQLTRISPKKTVEGTVGGLCCSVFASLMCHRLFCWPQSPVAACIFAILVFVASLFGDLIESIMKREAGMKDSGSLIPGHGGFLDRFDSYMFTGAIIYLYVKLVLPDFGI